MPSPQKRDLREAVARIVEDGHRAADILGRIRAQFAQGALNREVFDVSEIIQQTVRLLRGEPACNDVSVRMELADDLPQVLGDRVQVQQVVMNLDRQQH